MAFTVWIRELKAYESLVFMLPLLLLYWWGVLCLCRFIAPETVTCAPHSVAQYVVMCSEIYNVTHLLYYHSFFASVVLCGTGDILETKLETNSDLKYALHSKEFHYIILQIGTDFPATHDFKVEMNSLEQYIWILLVWEIGSTKKTGFGYTTDIWLPSLAATSGDQHKVVNTIHISKLCVGRGQIHIFESSQYA